MNPRGRRIALCLLLGALASVGLGGCRWQATWARSQGPLLTASTRTDESVRVIARVRSSSVVSRIRLQNTFGPSQAVGGNSSITVGAATVGRRTTGASVDSGTIRELTFSGRRAVTIAPGASVVSDPVQIPVSSGSDVAISLFLPSAQVPAGHSFETVTGYSTPDGAGDHTGEASRRGVLRHRHLDPDRLGGRVPGSR